MIGPKTTLTLKRIVIDPETGLPAVPEEWITIKNVKGVLVTFKGEEIYTWGRIAVYSTHHFYMDYPKGFTISEVDRLYLGEREFKIDFINNLGASQNNRLKVVLDEIV